MCLCILTGTFLSLFAKNGQILCFRQMAGSSGVTKNITTKMMLGFITSLSLQNVSGTLKLKPDGGHCHRSRNLCFSCRICIMNLFSFDFGNVQCQFLRCGDETVNSSSYKLGQTLKKFRLAWLYTANETSVIATRALSLLFHSEQTQSTAII